MRSFQFVEILSSNLKLHMHLRHRPDPVSDMYSGFWLVQAATFTTAA